MKIGVIGLGHVGLTTAACLAHVGHDVVGVDSDLEKVRLVARGDVPFHEPGLTELVREGVETRRLEVTDERGAASRHGDVVFICVATPTRPTGEADLAQVEQVAESVAQNLNGYKVVAGRSTVPVATADWVRRSIERRALSDAAFDVASNPEFLREGRAVIDTLEPDRIVVGASSSRAVEWLREVFRPILDRSGCPFVVTDPATAELVKLASNAFLATKISFINSVADLCDRTGADVEQVAYAMGLDPRIGTSFLRAGIGFGGGCLPKDMLAFRHSAMELGTDFEILEAAERVNAGRVASFMAKIRSVAGDLNGARVAVWGLAFKPDTDDIRRAPAVEVVRRLLESGASVTAYDPSAMDEFRALIPEIGFASGAHEAASGADCLVICTEWDEFATVDLPRLRRDMSRPVVVDGRNVFAPEAMAAAGLTYASIGRPTVSPA